MELEDLTYNNPLCGWYKLVHVETERFYVGSTRNLYSRFSTHLSNLKNGKHTNKELQKAYNQDNRIKVVFYLTETIEDAIEQERTFLNKNKNTGIVFNDYFMIKNTKAKVKRVLTIEGRVYATKWEACRMLVMTCSELNRRLNSSSVEYVKWTYV